MTAKRLWDKGEDLNKQVHEFTVGNDPQIDKELVYWDALGSGAHAQMLQSIGLLSAEECTSLLSGLKQICRLAEKGKFEIPVELEDCHTAIEDFLIKQAKEAGQKIHAGRSRNDQILLAMRLYLRNEILKVLNKLIQLSSSLLSRYDQIGHHVMPGYTHFQPAMPSSVGMWLHAFAEASLEMISDGLSLIERINSNPLGSASGFGVPLPLDRDLVTKLLAFSKTQRSVIDVQNSRGRFELKFINWGADIAGVVEKLAWDMILYSSREFGFFTIPPAFTTGSSIMPQKHNPDVLELLRARAGKVRAAANELLWIIAKLPSNYHRDLQYTKEPVIKCAKNLVEILTVVEQVVASFSVNEQRLSQAMTPELYATYDACKEVRDGLPFREAYRRTAQRVKDGSINKKELEKDFSLISQTVAKEVAQAKHEFAQAQQAVGAWQKRLTEVEQNVLK
jgi:argininosuccinate lyase